VAGEVGLVTKQQLEDYIEGKKGVNVAPGSGAMLPGN
jgi:hypothetical protein